MYTTRVMSSKSLQIFEALLLLRTILNRWCGSPAKAIEKKENRQTSRSFILSKVIKSVGLNFPPAVLTGDRKKKKQFFLVSRQVLSLKKHVRLRTDSILQCVFMRFSTCCPHVYSRWFTATSQWGDTILSLSESCLLSNPVGKTTKTPSSKQVILQMHSICFSFKDMRSEKIWRDEVKAAENLLLTPAVAKSSLVFWNCTGSQRRNHLPTLGII